MDDLEGAPIPRPEGVKPMTISSNPLRSTRKSTQTDVISQSPDKHYISVACAPVVGLPSSFHRLCGSLATRRVENLWPQNSVSKVAVCHVPTAPDFDRRVGSSSTL
jgi:hypothetical protein